MPAAVMRSRSSCLDTEGLMKMEVQAKVEEEHYHQEEDKINEKVGL